MSDAAGGAVGETPQPLVLQAVVACQGCGAWNDVWAESCACGAALLADTRKLKLAKGGGEPKARLERRAKANEESPQPTAREQAVRDLAALRAVDENKLYTYRIARLLLDLGRFDEGASEALAMHERHELPADIAVTLSYHCEGAGDLAAANAWVDRGYESSADELKPRVPLVCERARLLADHGSARDALGLLEALKTELDAAIKKTEKGGGGAVGSLFGADPATFAASYWSAETTTLNGALAHAKDIVKDLDRAEHEAAKHAKMAQRAAEGKTHWWQL